MALFIGIGIKERGDRILDVLPDLFPLSLTQQSILDSTFQVTLPCITA